MLRQHTDPKNSRPNRILIVRLSAHGDVIHTLPLLSALKRENPGVHIGWLVESAAVPLLEHHPLIDCLHVSHRKRWLKACLRPWAWPAAVREVRELLREIRKQEYQVSLDVQGLLKSAIWPWLAGIPVRLGYGKARERAELLYTHTVGVPDLRNPNIPAVERTLDFARAIGYEAGKPEFVIPPVSEAVHAKVSALLETGFGDETRTNRHRKLIVLAPFTRWESKHWKSAYWTELLRLLLAPGEFPDLIPILLGGPGDLPAAERLLAPLTDTEKNRVLMLVGRTDWPDLYALFSRARLVIGPDSAPLHIADAVGVPELIGLYGPTAPGRTGPVGPKAGVLNTVLSCQPCFAHACPLGTHECMAALKPERVLAEIRTKLALPAGKAETP